MQVTQSSLGATRWPSTAPSARILTLSIKSMRSAIKNALASSCITTMMITRGLRRRFCHPSCFQPQGSILPARRKSEVHFMYLSWRRFNINVEVVTHERPMVWRVPSLSTTYRTACAYLIGRHIATQAGEPLPCLKVESNVHEHRQSDQESSQACQAIPHHQGRTVSDEGRGCGRHFGLQIRGKTARQRSVGYRSPSPCRVAGQALRPEQMGRAVNFSSYGCRW